MAFPNHYLGQYVVSTGQFVSGHVALTAAQLTVLKSEITNDPAARGYAGKTDAQVADLLNAAYTIANPAAQGTVPRGLISRDEFLGGVLGKIDAVLARPTTDPLQPKWQRRVNLLSMAVMIDTGSPAVSGMLADGVNDTVLATSDVTLLTTLPDPTWQATIAEPPRGDVIFGSDGVFTLEASDVTAARSA